MPGSVLTGTPASRVMSTIRWRTSPEADGIAISTSSGRFSWRIRESSSVVPSTRTLCTRRFFLRGSSSTSPIGVYPSEGLFSSSLMISCAASPAPTTITSLPRATRPRAVGRSMSVRASIRAPATKASSSSQSMIATERGSRTPATGFAK
jgi:hypothetical protein